MQARLFESLVESDAVQHKTAQSKTVSMSMAIHGAIVLAVIIVPLLTSEELPELNAAARAFFVEPPSAPPPPPPPPPPAAKAPNTPKTPPKPVEENKFVAPIETPPDIKPESNVDLGIDSGVPGGVEGGVSGGVVGGVVGGLPSAPPPTEPVRVGGNIKEPKRVKYVDPKYPDIARTARVQGVVILECVISPQGKVTEAKVLRSIPLLEQAALEAVKQWVYTPTLLNGVPVPVVMTVTVNFRLN
jgi:periplasmic protein TonB